MSTGRTAEKRATIGVENIGGIDEPSVTFDLEATADAAATERPEGRSGTS